MSFLTIAMGAATAFGCLVASVAGEEVTPFGVKAGEVISTYQSAIDPSKTNLMGSIEIDLPVENPLLYRRGVAFLTPDNRVCAIQARSTDSRTKTLQSWETLQAELRKRYPTFSETPWLFPTDGRSTTDSLIGDGSISNAIDAGKIYWSSAANSDLPSPLSQVVLQLHGADAGLTIYLTYFFNGFPVCGFQEEEPENVGAGL